MNLDAHFSSLVAAPVACSTYIEDVVSTPVFFSPTNIKDIIVLVDTMSCKMNKKERSGNIGRKHM